MSSYCFIVNPVAGKGKAKKAIEVLQQEIGRRRLDAELRFTERQGDATALAAQARAPVVVAVGGDGTVNEVANGIAGTDKVLAVVPSGSGNDLVKSIGIPVEITGALDVLSEGHRTFIDAAVVRCSSSVRAGPTCNSNSRYFVNGVGIGFDAAVAERTASIKYLGGFALYLVAVLQTLGKYSAPTFRVQLDGEVAEGKHLLIAIGNGRCAGGGFYLTPRAEIDDGSLDVCLIDDMSVPSILRLMPRVMKGTHDGYEGVRMTRTERITVEASEPFFVHADGEMVGRGVNRVDVEIRKGTLQVVVGERRKHGTSSATEQ